MTMDAQTMGKWMDYVERQTSDALLLLPRDRALLPLEHIQQLAMICDHIHKRFRRIFKNWEEKNYLVLHMNEKADEYQKYDDISITIANAFQRMVVRDQILPMLLTFSLAAKNLLDVLLKDDVLYFPDVHDTVTEEFAVMPPNAEEEQE